MPRISTPHVLHFIIPNGEQLNFVWDGEFYSVYPIQMLNSNWAVPYSVINTPGLPEEFKQSLLSLNNCMELNCCNFKVCNHGG